MPASPLMITTPLNGDKRVASDRPHAVMITGPGSGHVIPTCQMANTLANSGVSGFPLFQVTLFIPCPTVDLYKIQNIVCPPNVNIVLWTKDIGVDVQAIFQWIFTAGDDGSLLNSITGHIEKNLLPSPVVVIIDMFIAFGKPLAEMYGASLWSFFPSPSFSMQVFTKILKSTHGVKDYGVHLPGIGFVDKDEYPEMPTEPENGEYSPEVALVVNGFVRCFAELYNCAGMLCNDVDGFYRDGLVAACKLRRGFEYLNVGPLSLYDCREDVDDDPTIAWLDTHPPDSVVYVALGSWGQLSGADTVELALALAKLGRPCLWAHRPRAKGQVAQMQSVEREFEDEVDECGLPVGYVGLTGGMVRTEKWINQMRVLKHEAINCFITHCGWNSTLEAISLSGKPMLALPLGAEQVLNARVIEEYFKIGTRIWKNRNNTQLDRHELADTIMTVYNSKELKENAKRLQKLALDAVKEDEDGQRGSSLSNYGKFIDIVFKNKCLE